MTKDIGLRGASRRDFVRGVFAASAALGLGPARAYDVLEKMGGSALADTGTTSNKFVHCILGNGAGSMATTMFPLPILIESPNAMFSIDDPAKYAKMTLANGNKMYHRVVDGKPIFEKRPWTAFISGVAQAHSNFPAFANNNSNISVGGTGEMSSCASALQNTQAALVPLISIQRGGAAANLNPVAPGAPAAAQVANADAMVSLFSSAASRLMARLQPAVNQTLFQQYYTAFLGLAVYGDKPTYARAKSDAKVALSLVVKNLASQLQPDPMQLQRWAGGSTLIATDNKFTDMARSLSIGLNAFKLGLTSQIIFNAFNNDPHGHWAQTAAQYTEQNDVFSRIWNGFYTDADAIVDSQGRKLGDHIVSAFTNDTPKTPFNRVNWGDGNTANYLYVQGLGHIQPGWIGDQLNQNSRINFDPATGKQNAAVATTLSTSASIAATLFAVNGGGPSTDPIRPFFSLDFSGIINKSLT